MILYKYFISKYLQKSLNEERNVMSSLVDLKQLHFMLYSTHPVKG